MSQEVFSDARKGTGMGITADAAAGFVGLLSLFNSVGRFFWSSLSDTTGRKRIYMIYLGLGALLVVGFICNLPVKPVDAKYQVKDESKPVLN